MSDPKQEMAKAPALGDMPAEEFRRDSDLFAQAVREPEAQGLLGAALRGGFQTRDAEIDLPSMLGDLARAGQP